MAMTTRCRIPPYSCVHIAIGDGLGSAIWTRSERAQMRSPVPAPRPGRGRREGLGDLRPNLGPQGSGAAPGSWETIDAWWIRNGRISSSDTLVGAPPSTRIRPPAMIPLRGEEEVDGGIRRAAASALPDVAGTTCWVLTSRCHAAQHGTLDAADDIGQRQVLDSAARQPAPGPAVALVRDGTNLRSVIRWSVDWSESAIRFTATTVLAIAMAGNRVDHQIPAIMLVYSSLTLKPQSGDGGWSPTPRNDRVAT